jgi:anti-sigma B factor antagonist
MARAVALISADHASDGEPIVDVRGEIDVGSAPALREWLIRASDGGRRSVVVDLRGVEFLAISGLYVLCDEQQRMAAHRARLTVVCSDPRALQLFEVCRLEEVLHVVAARESAPAPAWGPEDEARAARLEAWLARYAAESESA